MTFDIDRQSYVIVGLQKLERFDIGRGEGFQPD